MTPANTLDFVAVVSERHPESINHDRTIRWAYDVLWQQTNPVQIPGRSPDKKVTVVPSCSTSERSLH